MVILVALLVVAGALADDVPTIEIAPGVPALADDVPTIEIAAGVHMPLAGLGCGGGWAGNGSAVFSGVTKALSLGYRAFDTALGYGTQESLAAALRNSKVPRSIVFITSKVPGGLGRKGTADALTQSLSQLNMSYVDLMLLHVPAAWNGTGGGREQRQEAWRAMEDLVHKGGARAIGVSHYCPRHIEDILAIAKVPISLNQVEFHVGMGHAVENKTDGKSFDKQHHIAYQSFMPLCGQCETMDLITGELVSKIGKAHGKTGSQVSLRWLVQQGIPVIPRSGNPLHQKQNFELFDWALSDEEMSMLSEYSNDKIGGLSTDCQIA